MGMKELAAPLPADVISWKQQTRPKAGRSGGFYSLYVAYVDVHVVRRRLDEAAGAENWQFRVKPILAPSTDMDGHPTQCVVGSLEVAGLTREDIGEGTSFKAATSDCFKRAARLFGIGAELWEMPKVYVEMSDGDKYAKPVNLQRDIDAALKKAGSSLAGKTTVRDEESPVGHTEGAAQPQQPQQRTHRQPDPEAPADAWTCPECQSTRCYDNRADKASGKKTSKWPDYKCKDCQKAVWLEPKSGASSGGSHKPLAKGNFEESSSALTEEFEDDLPF